VNETFLFLLLAAICLMIGAFIGNLFARLKNKTETGKLEERLQNSQFQEEKLNERLGHLVSEKDILQKEKESANVQLSRQSAEYESLRKELEKEKDNIMEKAAKYDFLSNISDDQIEFMFNNLNDLHEFMYEMERKKIFIEKFGINEFKSLIKKSRVHVVMTQ